MTARINLLLFKLGFVFASITLALAVLTSNATCYFLTYQPDEPAGLEKFK